MQAGLSNLALHVVAFEIPAKIKIVAKKHVRQLQKSCQECKYSLQNQGRAATYSHERRAPLLVRVVKPAALEKVQADDIVRNFRMRTLVQESQPLLCLCGRQFFSLSYLERKEGKARLMNIT